MTNGGRVFCVAVMMLGLYAYGRSGPGIESAVEAESYVGVFSSPQVFLAAPGGSATSINLRRGPGREFRAFSEAKRGVRLIGTARRLDSEGASWIELELGQGFAKESVLVKEVK